MDYQWYLFFEDKNNFYAVNQASIEKSMELQMVVDRDMLKSELGKFLKSKSSEICQK